MSSKNPRQRFQDIVENIDRIEQYVQGMDCAAFLADRKTIDAVERCLARVSEAAVKLGSDAERLVPDLSWRDIRGIGNHLRHAYDAVSPARLWQTIGEDLPLLKAACLDQLRKPD